MLEVSQWCHAPSPELFSAQIMCRQRAPAAKPPERIPSGFSCHGETWPELEPPMTAAAALPSSHQQTSSQPAQRPQPRAQHHQRRWPSPLPLHPRLHHYCTRTVAPGVFPVPRLASPSFFIPSTPNAFSSFFLLVHRFVTTDTTSERSSRHFQQLFREP